MGLDVGDRWVGVALSDPLGILASPLTRIERADDRVAVEAIAALVREHEARLVVAGLPYSLDGTVGEQAVRVQEFLRQVSGAVGVPIETWDERLSTVAAKRGMAESGARRGKEKIDAAAAALILQGYLDRLRLEEREARDEASPANPG
ncbi:MAG: Holliday junction resolvase RuvX [Dehalococcoidia bacterium]|nr:Holliday junction resolvase RuvX [Dehalococcoidia bacterium]